MMNQRRYDRLQEVLENRIGRLTCAVESLYHRHNVSAVLRTCDSVGVQHVHLVEGNFHAAKGTTKGAERWLTLHKHHSPSDAIAALRNQGFSIWIADFAEDGVAPEAVPTDTPICVWLGAELVGVSEEARQAADGVITIPMSGFAQSLNISVAAAVILYSLSQRVRSDLGADAHLPDEERQALWDMWLAREEAMRVGIQHRS